MKITGDCMVQIRYTLKDDEGTVVEESEKDGPIAYLHGSGSILPGLEKALDGAEAGARLEVRLDPADAYGDYDPEGLIQVPRLEFPPDAELVPGDWISLTVSDDDGPDGGEEPGESGESEIELRVVEIGPDAITLDANHPLAGREVTFKVEVLDVRTATEEEIEHAQHDCEHDH